MTCRVITISREFGSGGRTIGMQVASQLGLRYYDRELIAKIAEKSGLNPSYIEKYGEYATSTSRFLYNLELHGAYSGESLSIPDQLYVIQHNTIVELAAAELCVIVGRCSDYALRERDDCLHVFLHADPSFRADRIVRVYGETVKDPLKRIEEMDGRRKVYYEYYTGQTWGMAKNYDISLNTARIGLDACASLIRRLAAAR